MRKSVPSSAETFQMYLKKRKKSNKQTHKAAKGKILFEK